MNDSERVEKAVQHLETALETEDWAETSYLIREALHLLTIEGEE